MSELKRSELACPSCGRHTLAIDEPPRIDVMGVQAWSDMVGMGDLQDAGVPGIVCLGCDTHWRSREAFDRDEPEPAVDEDGLVDVDEEAPDSEGR